MTSFYPDNKLYKRTVSVPTLKYFIVLLCIVAAMGVFSSCTEKPTIIGLDLLPEGDFTSTKSTDTVSVFSYTYSVDSVRTNNKAYSYLGGLYDPYFGTSLTGFVGQLRLLKDFKGGDAFFIDSVKLYFSIAGAKGVLKTRQELRIFEIDEQLSSDTSYYSNRDPHIIKDFGSVEIPIIKKDSAQELAVILPNSLGEYLFRDTAMLFQDNPLTDFRSYFNGIHMQLSPVAFKKGFSKGTTNVDSLMLIALTFDQNDFILRVFYQTAKAQNLFYDFTINPNSVRYNLYSHDFSSAQPGKMIQHVDDNVKDTLSYLQGFNGVYTKIKIPGLESLKSLMPVSVNRAKLTVPAFLDGSLYTVTTVPAKIYLSYWASDGNKYIVPDYLVNPAFFDGSFSSTTKKYTFNLASFVQQYLEGKIPLPELEMYLSEGEYKNVILKANHSTTPVKFEFTYTRF